MHLNDRSALVKATLEHFGAHPFEWGKFDCGKMVIHHVKGAGHAARTGGSWATPVGLARFLRRHGGSGAACLDGWGLQRIPPAYALLGDVVEIDGGEPPFGAFGIAVGNGRVMAYHEAHDGLTILQPSKLVAAWRI